MTSDEGEATRKKVDLTALAPPARGGVRLMHLMYGIGIVAVAVWVGMLAGAWLITGSIVLLIVTAIGMAVVLAKRSVTQEESLLWSLAIAAERSVPLAPATLAFADQFGRSYRWRAQLLSRLLDEGKTLPEALDRVPGLISRDNRVLVRTGWATGTLPRALHEAASARVTREQTWGAITGRVVYVVGFLLAMQLIAAFIMYFIAPKFEAIFNDFGIPLPAITAFTIGASHRLVEYGALPTFALLLAEVALLIVLPLGLFNVFQWDIPLIDALFRRRHTALLLQALSLTVEGEKPIPEGLALLASDYPSGWVRRRLRLVIADVGNGVDWVRSLAARGLINASDAAVLSSAQRVGNLTWALRETSASAVRRLGYRLQLAIQIIFPFVIMSMGFVVFVFAVSYFLPVVRLIERLAG